MSYSLGWMAAFCVFAVPLAATVMAEDNADHHESRRTITVSGTGKVSAAPDTADINIGVITNASSAKDALAANNEAMSEIHRVLKERGIAAKDIQTINLSIAPQYSQPGQPRPGQRPTEFVPRIVGYQVNNSVQITARDLDKLGQVLDAVVQAGSNQMNGISFRIAEPEKLLDVARKQAMSDARRKAELLAGEAGVVVGLPISIQDAVGAFPPPRPMFGRAMAMEAAAVPIAAGEQELSVSVTIVYELKSAK